MLLLTSFVAQFSLANNISPKTNNQNLKTPDRSLHIGFPFPEAAPIIVSFNLFRKIAARQLIKVNPSLELDRHHTHTRAEAKVCVLAPDGRCYALQMEESLKMCDGGRADQTLVGFNYSAWYRLGPPLRAPCTLLGFLSTHSSLSRSGTTHTRTHTHSLSHLGFLSALCNDCAK